MSERYLSEILKDGPAWLYMLDDSGRDDLAVDTLRATVGNHGSYTTISNVTRRQRVPITGALPGLGCRFTRAGGAGSATLASIVTSGTLGGGDFTMACWMQRLIGAAAERHNYWGKRQSAEINIGFALNASGHVVARYNQCTPVEITMDTSPGGWKHYAYTVVGNTVQPYVNGVAGTPVDFTVKSFVGEDNQIDIKGHAGTGGIDFNLHAIYAYTSALSADRIAAHYRAAVQQFRLAGGRPWARTNFKGVST